MPLEFSDTFTEGSNTLLTAHTPTLGTSWTQITDSSANAQVLAANDTARADAAQTSRYLIALTNPTPTLADYDVVATIAAKPGAGTDDTVGLVGRVVDGDNLYGIMVYHSAATQHSRLFKRVAGVISILDSDTVTAVVAGDILKLEIRGTTLKGYLNAVEVLSATDSSFSAAGSAGMGWGDLADVNDDIITGWELDDFSLTTVDTATGQPTMKRWGGIPHMEPRGRGVW